MEEGLPTCKFGLNILWNIYLNKLKILPFESFTKKKKKRDCKLFMTWKDLISSEMIKEN